MLFINKFWPFTVDIGLDPGTQWGWLTLYTQFTSRKHRILSINVSCFEDSEEFFISHKIPDRSDLMEEGLESIQLMVCYHGNWSVMATGVSRACSHHIWHPGGAGSRVDRLVTLNTCLHWLASPAMPLPLTFPQLPKTPPLAKDRVFTHMSLQKTFLHSSHNKQLFQFWIWRKRNLECQRPVNGRKQPEQAQRRKERTF